MRSEERKGIKNLEEIKEKLQKLRDLIKERYKAEVIGIFGSYVRGEQRKESDIDILVKFYRGATLFELVGLSLFLEEEIGIKVDIVPYDAVRKEIKEKVLSEVVCL
ncbi:MAG: nucleotidyltransferase family protein [Thermodesulfobacterium sp.]|nr:nucleotidyltransferase family protein [Thermodesulfobacterium sp.]